MKWRSLLNLPEKFRKLEDRLPENVVQAKKTIKLSEDKEREREKRIKKWKDFEEIGCVGLVLCYLAVNALGLSLIFSLGPPVWWTWCLVVLLFLVQLLTCVYNEKGLTLPEDEQGRDIIDPRLIYPNAHTKRRNSCTSTNKFLWYTLGFPHWIHRYGQVLKLRAQELEKPQELQDDRLPALRSFFHNMEAWDHTVKMINRLIDQAELELIPLEDITKLIAELRSDEKYLTDNMEYIRRLLLEGPLGTSRETNRSADEIVDEIDGRLTEIVKHQEELRELSGKIAARMEVSSR